MAEAQVVYGDDFMQRSVVQVVSSLSPPPRAGSLVVTRAEILINSREPLQLKDLAGLVLIKSTASESAPSTINQPATSAPPLANAAGAALAAVGPDVQIKRLTKLCSDVEVPLIVVPGFGEPGQVADDIRMAFLREIKQAGARLHASLLSLVLEEGLEGLVEELGTSLNRPISIETADFKVLASRNMGVTPANQQRTVSDEMQNALKRISVDAANDGGPSAHLSPLKIGRRLVLPVCLGDDVVGYIAVMVRPNDELESIGEALQAAALAAMVDFSQRQKDGSVFSVTQKSLLKDLLSGRGLSASDTERLERHYGFDMADGILVFAVQLAGKPSLVKTGWPEEGFITTEVEGTRIYLLASSSKSGTAWQEEMNTLIGRIKAATENGAAMKLQVGAARMAETLLDLPDAYREARQALIIGSMIHLENEFSVGYGDLGIKRLLYLMIDHPEFERFYEENLAPLEAYDEEWESELVSSLRVYLEQGSNLNSAARALYIHRHTLRYRLEQIAEILKVDIDSQEVLLNLQIAFMIGDMKGGVKGKP
ncbi:MAG TPA: helix-turn-helix domain-containing protein [Planktothrix sp.]